METKTYDYLVIGAGSGGLASARRAASHGAKVALFESDKIGGTCVNRGCVPKKVMFNAANLAEEIEDMAAYGFQVEKKDFDWRALVHRRTAYIDRLHTIYHQNVERAGIDYVQGWARLVDAHTVEANGQHYTAPHILLPMGGKPDIPRGIKGAEHGITSDEFFQLEHLPRRVAVVGSGYIAVEIAGILNALGSEVSMFVRSDRLLRSFDVMLQDHLRDEMRAQGIQIHFNSAIESIEGKDGDELHFYCSNGLSHKGYDTLLWAVGRIPLTREMGLEAAGVELTRDGYVVADPFQNTTVPGIYALGDVTESPALTPLAIAAGRKLADRLFGGQKDARQLYDQVPTAIFSHPPIGTVGLTEREARAKYEDVKVYTSTFTNMYYALGEKKPKTAMKLIVHGEQEHILGIHLIGRNADEIIQGFSVAVRMGACKADLDATLAIHPTSAEELVTMR
ncbi:MAG: glutathione-disulfide reductase [Myxococcales bacterium]|nr:glutathione-disulfide reductase [Myxococcales bacterium]MCB9643554.1 glutathione-disulfide reductase [Myxococcales bacterium]